MARYYASNKDSFLARSRDWYQDNTLRARRNSQRLALQTPERQREYKQKWVEKNPEKRKESSKRYRAAHPEKSIAHCQSRRARKNGCVVSAVDILEVVERSGGLCALCRAFVPENFRHIDHIIPLEKGGPHSQENLQLLCYFCNGSKGAKMPEQVTAPNWRNKSSQDQPSLLNPDWK